jgi:hypothetical protein
MFLVKKFYISQATIDIKEVCKLGNEEETDKKREQWLKGWLDRYKDFKGPVPLLKLLDPQEEEMESEEERHDVYIYKTLRYPPQSTPPTIE